MLHRNSPDPFAHLPLKLHSPEYHFHRYQGPNLVLKYNRAENRLMNIAVDDSDSPFYALRDTAGNAIGVTACDVDGDGREEIYFLNTNSAYSGKGCTTPFQILHT